MKNIVVVIAHPDDEAFGPGGTIAKLAQENNVYLLCATKGEAGQNYSPYKEKKLSEIRCQELINSAKILGVKKVYFLGFEDGTLSNNLYHALAEKIREHLKLLKPQMVITYELHGISGHLDHIAVAFTTLYACRDFPFIKQIWQYGILKKYSVQRTDYFIYFPPGYKESEFDKIINTESVWKIKIKAMYQHKSQIRDVERIALMQARLPKKEYFFVVKNK